MPNKTLWVVAGGNGAGKSSFYYSRMKSHVIPFINADEIGLTHFTQDGKTDAEKASHEAQRQVYAKLKKGESFCYETVFSHVSKIDIVAAAKGLGYEVNIVFIHLENSALNEARVYQRVKNDNGHDVSPNKIRECIKRTLENAKVAFKIADNVSIFDNSWGWNNPFVPIALKESNRWIAIKDPLPDWALELME